MDDATFEVKELSTNVPVFLLKLVNMLNDPDNQEYVDWTQAGTSFIVKDQLQFSKVVLPKYFKHNKFASFVRQLNMYGFRKVSALTEAGMASDKDKVEFFHYLFIRGEDQLLPQIKRKVNKPDPSAHTAEDVTKVLENVKEMKNHQDFITHRISDLKRENEDLWSEVIELRRKHTHQEQVVKKLVQFLVNLVHQTGMGVKRKLPLMIEDGSTVPEPTQKSAKPTIYVEDNSSLSLEQPTGPTVSFPTSNTENVERLPNSSGPSITEVATATNTGIFQPTYMSGEDRPNSRHETVSSNRDADDFTHFDEVTQPIEIEHLIQQPRTTHNPAINPLAPASSIPSSANTALSNPIHPHDITQYHSNNMGLSPVDLNHHIDAMQNNIDSIQDLLQNNNDVNLDYSIIQELFSTSPDIMPLVKDSALTNEELLGNELVLHGNSERPNNEDIIPGDLSDITDFL